MAHIKSPTFDLYLIPFGGGVIAVLFVGLIPVTATLAALNA